ncbi:Pentatricopeptide repeat-containing protein [Apostasia shenzhenica]|uniref:Pentatricopeptide repeat-containing protein n=1 Tax=Apostasia shenzhenica TaxID=1088818 RepID=A0A2I0B2N8_9ASPA|nr:Pentatricopeptide repeat-containing protein [Apostasia shenzhenica]
MLRRNPPFQPKFHFWINSLLPYTTQSLSSTIRRNLGLGQPDAALPHFAEWRKQAVAPDKFTIPSLLKLSSALGEPPLHQEHFHAFALKSGHLQDLFVSTGLLEIYFLNGHYDAPVQLFDEITERDLVFFTAMITGFAQNQHECQALEFFSKMLEQGQKPNGVTLSTVLSASSKLQKIELGKSLHCQCIRNGFMNQLDVVLESSLLDMYVKSGNVCYARKVFDEMRNRNVVSWNIIMAAYFSIGSFEIVLDLFKEMILGGWRHLRASILVLLLQVCGITTDLRKGKEIHGYILKSRNDIFELYSLVECNSIVDMYIKTGSLEYAVQLFVKMSDRNVVTWTTMISGYGIHGLSRKALEAFNEMKESGIRPDGTTFIAILSTCSHGGLVDEGREFFDLMKRDYNIIPEMKHYVCMVDLYGRAGFLDEALEFVRQMPIKPSKYIWGSLLSSCRKHKNQELGELVAERAMEIDQFDLGNYLLLCRIYADSGSWKDFARVRSIMKRLGLKSATACSWIEIKGKVYRFTVNDCSNPSSRGIYEFLKKLSREMKLSGFILDTSNAAHDVNEEDKVTDLCGHTEKLALAFSLMNSAEKKIIRIGKNLRVCSDCHEVFKFVSRAYDRDIILKDPNRYHRFSQGGCSCNDFW